MHDDEIVEIRAKESDDKFIEIDIEKAKEWIVSLGKMEKKVIDLDTEMEMAKEQESYANIRIAPD